MTTATGDVVVDFAAAADVSPVTNANFTYLDPVGVYRLQVLSNAVKSVSTSDYQPIWRYNGAMGLGVLRAKVEIAANLNGDFFCCYVVTTAATGYVLHATGATASIYPVTTGTINTGLRIGSVGTIAGSVGNVLALVYDPSTDTLSATENGSTISGAGGVDSTTTAGLAPAVGLDVQNSNGSSFKSMAIDGIAVAAGSARGLLLMGVG